MEYISSDTNIWLDFASIDKIDLPFRLPCTYIMFKEALLSEIASPPGLMLELQKNGLIGVEITIEEFFCASELAGRYVKLTGYDRIALSIAKQRNIRLLTGDKALRKAATKEKVKVFGTIGLLDELYNEKNITKEEYAYCLMKFLESKERRLPHDELKKRIDGLKTE